MLSFSSFESDPDTRRSQSPSPSPFPEDVLSGRYSLPGTTSLKSSSSLSSLKLSQSDVSENQPSLTWSTGMEVTTDNNKMMLSNSSSVSSTKSGGGNASRDSSKRRSLIIQQSTSQLNYLYEDSCSLKDDEDFVGVIQTPRELDARFVNRKLLAKTLQGEVYKAKDSVTNNNVVIKVAYDEYTKSRQSLSGKKIEENFENEIEIVRKLGSLTNVDGRTGIIEYIADYSLDNKRVLVMEHCNGGDMFDYCEGTLYKDEQLKPGKRLFGKKKFMKEKTSKWYGRYFIIQSLFKQLVDNVEFLHKNGITHLDLSLENVMICHKDLKNKFNPSIRVIDFGVSIDFNGRSCNKSSHFICYRNVGKPQYQAPEVYRCRTLSRAKAYDGRKADIWSMGVILFILLFWTFPYQKPSFRSCGRFRSLFGKENGLDAWVKRYEKNYLLTKTCFDLLKKLLTYNPNNRITIKQIKEHPFLNQN